jgi:hypothetical protein
MWGRFSTCGRFSIGLGGIGRRVASQVAPSPKSRSISETTKTKHHRAAFDPHRHSDPQDKLARSMTETFCTSAKPLADAHSSDPSHDREKLGKNLGEGKKIVKRPSKNDFGPPMNADSRG